MMAPYPSGSTSPPSPGRHRTSLSIVGGESTQTLPVLIFDGACGFCTSCVRMARRALPGRFAAIPWQRVDDLGRFGITADDAAASVQWVDRTGRTSSGHEALANMLVSAGGLWQSLGRAMVSRPLDRPAAAVYRFVARHRHQFPGGTPACSVPES